ncbi:MAG: VanZ family protein [Bryobacteraceae bacterium]|jgi:VanZ family protein
MRRLLLLVVAIVVYGSLYPWHFTFAGRPEPISVLLHSWPAEWNRFVVRDVVINVVLYIPLGAVACLAWLPRFPRAAPAVATAFCSALSLSMELLQNYVPGRVTSLSDLATNTVGAAVGAVLALALAPEMVPRLRSQARRASPGAVLLLAFWGAYQLYPFFPIVSSTRLRQVLHELIVTHTLSPVAVWAAAAEWFAAALALEAVLGRLRGSWLAGAMLVLGLRIFMPSRSLALDEVAGAALALITWEILPSKPRLPIGVWMALSAILLVELAPFHFTGHAAPFSWIPLGATFENERWGALVILLRKAFFYGAAIWLLVRAGIWYPVAGGALAVALFNLERAQRYLPGRTPEITDSVIAVVMTAALWALGERRSPRSVE